jgi:hypothetical protein
MATIMYVRSLGDVLSSIRGVNDFLAFRRSCGGPQRNDEMLGLWVRDGLDAALPSLLQVDNGLEEPGLSKKTAHVATGVGIRECVSLSSIWSICWLDGPLISNAYNPAQKREVILRVLGSARPLFGLARDRGLFFPVFNTNEPADHVAIDVRALAVRYQGLIGSTWLRYDSACGIVWPDVSYAGPRSNRTELTPAKSRRSATP